MKEKTLLKFSLISILLSLFLLFIFVDQLELDLTTISQTENIQEETSLKIIGRVRRITDTEKVAFIELEQQELKTIDVILFKERNLSLQENDLIVVEGSLEEHRGEKEIIANRIEIK